MLSLLRLKKGTRRRGHRLDDGAFALTGRLDDGSVICCWGWVLLKCIDGRWAVVWGWGLGHIRHRAGRPSRVFIR